MRSRLLSHSRWGLLVLMSGALCASQASAQTAAEFFHGKTITMIVSSASGGGYDTLSRVLASHLGRHIPGNPQVVVRNMAGAGGIVATNHLYNVAAKDGTVVGGVQNNTPFEPLFGTKAATYDPLKFNWLGTPSFEVAIASVWHKTPVNSWLDTRTHEITMRTSNDRNCGAMSAAITSGVCDSASKDARERVGPTWLQTGLEAEEIEEA